MTQAARTTRIATVLALCTLCAAASAQSTPPARSVCTVVGSNAPEPVGDRPGHAVQVSSYTCRVESGPLEGGVITGTTIYEHDAGTGVLLSGGGVVRKPGAVTAFQISDGKNAMVITDGKVTGFTASGKGVYKLATGSAAALAGKTFSYTVRSTAPGQFVIESTVD